MLRKGINYIRSKRCRFVKDLTGGINDLKKRAFLYYKTEPFYKKAEAKQYSHTNLWEILEIVRLLNIHGFIVDIIDRSADDFLPDDIYDLFIGLGAGNSGKHFAKYASVLNKAVKVIYAAGPEPNDSNKLVKERYEQFNQRMNMNAPCMRTITAFDFSDFVKIADCIFCLGLPGSFSLKSYSKHQLPAYPISPSSSPDIKFSSDWFDTRKKTDFMCFAGNGFICKGVDILVEAFLKCPDLNIHICGPDNEKAFFDAYGDAIKNASNITFEGFVTVGKDKFNRLCSICSYVVFNTASEGCATSVAACLRAGLVPIVNYEAGIETGDFGFELNEPQNRIENTMKVARCASEIDDDQYKARVFKTLNSSLQYTQGAFTKSFTHALLNVIEEFDL